MSESSGKIEFEEYFKENQKEEWKSVYLEYNLLYSILEEIQELETDEEITESDKKFMIQFEYENEKIKNFVSSFNTDIINKISKIVRDLRNLEIKLTSENIGEEANENNTNEEMILKELTEIKKDTTQLGEDLVNFESYFRINKLAFEKLIDAYDEIMERNIEEWVNHKLETEIFSNLYLEYYLPPLSEIYEYIKIIKDKVKKVIKNKENLEEEEEEEEEIKVEEEEEDEKEYFKKNR
jgi:hypothetical protein